MKQTLSECAYEFVSGLLSLRQEVSFVVLFSFVWFVVVFSVIILITQTYKTKKILQSPGTILYFKYLGKRKKIN